MQVPYMGMVMAYKRTELGLAVKSLEPRPWNRGAVGTVAAQKTWRFGGPRNLPEDCGTMRVSLEMPDMRSGLVGG